MRLGHIDIFVKDPLKSRIFYEDVLGFEFEIVQKNKFVWMRNKNIEILLRPKTNEFNIKKYEDSNFGLIFYTDNLEKTKEELIQKGVVFKGIDLSEKCLTFTDPDGNWLQLVNPIDH